MPRCCDHCKKSYVSKDRRRRFCSLECCWAWRRENKNLVKGAFTLGTVPWNSGTVGVMKANSGSFKKGRDNENKQPVGAVTFRADKNGGERAWVKVSDDGTPYDWKLRAVVNWEKVHGPVPSGYVVHHKDRDKTNDVITNLELQTRAEHIAEHRHEYEERRKLAASIATKRRHVANRLNRGAVPSPPRAPKAVVH